MAATILRFFHLLACFLLCDLGFSQTVVNPPDINPLTAIPAAAINPVVINQAMINQAVINPVEISLPNVNPRTQNDAPIKVVMPGSRPLEGRGKFNRIKTSHYIHRLIG